MKKFYSCASVGQYLNGVLGIASFLVESTDKSSATSTAYDHANHLNPDAVQVFVAVTEIEQHSITQMARATGVAS